MKRTVIFIILIAAVLSCAFGSDELLEQYRLHLREMVGANTDPGWFAAFSDEASRILLRERVTLRTMKLLTESNPDMHDDPGTAALEFTKIAIRVDTLLRKGESPVRVAIMARTRADRGDEAWISGRDNDGSPGDEIRSDRARGAIGAAKEKKSGNDSPGQGPK